MRKNRIQLDDLKPDSAAELTEAEVSRISGGFASRHTGGAHFLLADGSVRNASTPDIAEYIGVKKELDTSSSTY